jgi:hypothetical protein
VYRVGGRVEVERCDTGEPADRPRQVGPHRVRPGFEDFLVPSVAFGEHRHGVVVDDAVIALPRAHGPRECGQQHITHVGPERFWRGREDRFGDGGVDETGVRAQRADAITRPVDRGAEIGGPLGQPFEPVTDLTGVLTGTLGDGSGPRALRGGVDPQPVRMALRTLGPQGDEILDDRLP